MPPTVKRPTRPTRKASDKALVVPAIEIVQGRGRTVFAFPVDGKLLPKFASVTRIARTESDGVTGYQRPEVLSHINQIRKYLESSDPMLPNAIVVAFTRAVRFTPVTTSSCMQYGRLGSLSIPLPSDGEPPPGLIVDGQQRTAALREAELKRFPVFVVGFVAGNEAEQREQFLLVNSTKPLPKGLLYELLPSIDAPLPDALARRRFPATLLERLNHDPDSPFRGMISTPTAPKGVVKDNSVLKMLDNSLTDGALFRFRNADKEGGDAELMLALLKNYWAAVSEAFPAAWGKPPKRSRLMHGAGIVSMGFLMDALSDQHRTKKTPSVMHFRLPLTEMAPQMRWSDGYWDFGPGNQIKWCDLQNTSRHIQLLTDYVLNVYRSLARRRRQ
jgi:DGQHR domain-containing protein